MISQKLNLIVLDKQWASTVQKDERFLFRNTDERERKKIRKRKENKTFNI